MNPHTVKYCRCTFGNSKSGPGVFIKKNMDIMLDYKNLSFSKTNIFNNDSYSATYNYIYPANKKMFVLYNFDPTILTFINLHIHYKLKLFSVSKLFDFLFLYSINNTNNINLVTASDNFTDGSMKNIYCGYNGTYNGVNVSWVDLYRQSKSILLLNSIMIDVDFVIDNGIYSVYFSRDMKLQVDLTKSFSKYYNTYNLKYITMPGDYSDSNNYNCNILIDDIFISNTPDTFYNYNYYLERELIPYPLITDKDSNTFGNI